MTEIFNVISNQFGIENAIAPLTQAKPLLGDRTGYPLSHWFCHQYILSPLQNRHPLSFAGGFNMPYWHFVND
jgi:hypothetical protein